VVSESVSLNRISEVRMTKATRPWCLSQRAVREHAVDCVDVVECPLGERGLGVDGVGATVLVADDAAEEAPVAADGSLDGLGVMPLARTFAPLLADLGAGNFHREPSPQPSVWRRRRRWRRRGWCSGGRAIFSRAVMQAATARASLL
jgi:hypothetical protein